MSLMPEFFEPDAHLFFVFRHCSSGDVVKDKDEKIIAFSWLKLRDAVRNGRRVRPMRIRRWCG